MSDLLLDEIRKSMTEMQEQMQSTYMGLENLEVVGEFDGVTIKLTCTYKLTDIGIQPKAMQGGLKDFTHRLRKAWEEACDAVQKATQNKTMDLMKHLQIPEDLRNISLGKNNEDDDQGRIGNR